MKSLYEVLFDAQSIYEMFFFDVKSVLEYPTFDSLMEKNKLMADNWSIIAKDKYGNIDDVLSVEEKYEKYAIHFPEYTKIVAITYANMYLENGEMKRHMKKISNSDEYLILATFMELLNDISSDGIKSTPQYFPYLCGHNLMNRDIPLLIKRYLNHRDKIDIDDKILPFILKLGLDAKPWESRIIDVIKFWNFNGGNNKYTLQTIGDFMGLKRKDNLLSLNEISKYYWDNIENENESLEFISFQSAMRTNLVIQLILQLRPF